MKLMKVQRQLPFHVQDPRLIDITDWNMNNSKQIKNVSVTST